MMTRDQRALVAGSVVLFALVLAFRAAPPWRAWRAEARARAVEKLQEVGRTQAVLEGLSEALDTLEARTARLRSLGSLLIVGETHADATANLVAAVAEMARAAAVRLETGETHLDTSSHRPLALVSLDAQATGDVVGLASLLHALERGHPLLSVRRLVVRPQSDPNTSTQVEMLSIRLTVEGLALIPHRDLAP